MIFGILCIFLAVLANIFSFWNYFLAYKINKEKSKIDVTKKITLGRLSYRIMSIFVIFASIYLFYLLIANEFQVKYIYEYTSKDLPLFYILSAFWAGQEGSFLLWVLFISIFGLLFIKSSHEFEIPSMILLNTMQFFFLLILIKASPFEILPYKPSDGSGLNPLLQNPWMAIHPPVLFAGYAAITFPFVLTLGSLLLNKYNECTDRIRFWTLLSSITLGAGIILGAYWAYGVLGWGGYWGWDPVENASLIPWIIIIALLHGLLIQRRNKKLYKTNIILAILAFILVLYATFLTRSGILSDFSVHSFINLGINNYLIIFIVFSILLSIIILKKTYTSLQYKSVESAGKLNRENTLLYSIYILLAISILIFIGTSFPIITSIISNPAQVESSFYDRVNFPFAIFMGLFLGITPFLLWLPGRSVIEDKQSVIISVIVSFLITFTGYMGGLDKISHLFFLFSASFAFSANTLVFLKKGLKNWRNNGVHIAHIGTGLLFIGIIISGTLSIDQNVIISKDKITNSIGYDLTYKNKTPMPDGKDLINIEVKNDISAFLAQPKYYFSKKSNQWIREPYIYSSLLNDIYISPLKEETASNQNSITIKKGETTKLDDYLIHFKAFDLSRHSNANEFHVGASLDITKDGTTVEVVPSLIFSGNERLSRPARLPDIISNSKNPVLINLLQMNADNKTIQLSLSGISNNKIANTEKFLIQISKKPMMNVLWLGSILMVFGSIIALFKRK